MGLKDTINIIIESHREDFHEGARASANYTVNVARRTMWECGHAILEEYPELGEDKERRGGDRSKSDTGEGGVTFASIGRELERDKNTITKWVKLAKRIKTEGEWVGYAQDAIEDLTQKQIEGWDKPQISAPSTPLPDDIFLYNIWNLQSGDDKEFFGHFPEAFMKSLLHYHTEPRAVVFDPFAGSGTTIDCCEAMGRHAYCYDLNPARDNISQHDIADGLPDGLPDKIDLAFLDPPYWAQAARKYSEDDSDLGNMDFQAFNAVMHELVLNLTACHCTRIAIVISPTQWPTDNHRFVDHIFDFHSFMDERYQIEMRYLLPYSTQQYNGTQVNIAKKEKIPLSIIRDLVVWRLR